MWPEMGIEFQVFTASLFINPQNSEIELQDQYSTNSFDLSFPLKLLILAFRRALERPNVARNGCRIQSLHCTVPYTSSLKLQNSEIELQDQYSMDFHGLSLSLKLLITAFRPTQKHPKQQGNGYNN